MSTVIGDKVFLTVVISLATVIFTWIVAFPIAIYSATHKYSWGDHGLTLLGFLGLATPNFLLALVMLYFANVWFGTTIGGLMEPQYIDQPMSWGKFVSVLQHLWIPVIIIGTSGTAGDDTPTARQPHGRAAKALLRHRQGEGPAARPRPDQVSLADVA